MSKVTTLQDSWSLGAKPDVPREKLPDGSCYQLTDAWPDLDAPVRKRGGWNRPWNATGTGTYIQGVGFFPKSGAYKVLVVTDGENLFTGTYASATMTSVGTARNIAHPPVFYRDKAYFFDLDGSAVPRVYDGAAINDLTTSPPTAAVGCVWKDHLVCARTSSLPWRVFFAKGGDPTTWNTAAPDAGGQTWDMSFPVQGMAVLKGMILVFEEGATERLRGNIIPGVVGSDMVREPLFNVGCSDPASIVATDDYVVFANSNGVYLTDASAVVDLSEQAGISRDWKNTMSAYALSWTIAAGIYNGWYVCSIMDGSTFKGAYAIDVRKRIALKLSNVKATMIATTPIGMVDLAPKIIMGERATNRASDLSTMWTPSSSYKNDGDGTAVTWSMESPYYMGKRGLKRFRRLWASYSMQDAATDNPTLTVSYQNDLASASYTTLGTLSETTGFLAEPLPLNVRSEGVSVKVAQTNASADTRFYALEAETQLMEQSRRLRS